MNCRIKNRAFTLVEILVVISIISLLSSIIITYTNESRENARIVSIVEFEGYMERTLAGTKVGDWKFEKGPEGEIVSNAVDGSSNTNPTAYGDPRYSTEVANEKASKFSVSFDGGDAIRLATATSHPKFNFTEGQNFALGAWFRTTATGHRRIISNGHLAFTNGYLLQLNNGYLWTGIGSVRAQSMYARVNGTYNDGKWHYALVTFNQEKKKRQFMLMDKKFLLHKNILGHAEQ